MHTFSKFKVLNFTEVFCEQNISEKAYKLLETFSVSGDN